MKLISGLIVLAIAIIISTVAAYFSVVGLAALFAATMIPVIIMGSAIEAGKFIATSWLHANWKNPNVTLKLKSSMAFMILTAMLVTAIGVYGFLSKGHLEQEAPVEGLQLQIAQKQQQITMLQEDNQSLVTKQKQLDSSIDTYLKKDNAAGGLRARKAQSSERQSIDKQIAANNVQIKALNEEVLPLKMQTSEVQAKLGPVKYVAELFGYTDSGSAVRMIILLIMIVFDPFALLLLVSATITLGEHFKEKAEAKLKSMADRATTIEDELLSLFPNEMPNDHPTPEPIISKEKPAAFMDPHPDFGEAPEELAETSPAAPKVEPEAPVEPVVEVQPKRRKKKVKETKESVNDYNTELQKFVKVAYGVDKPAMEETDRINDMLAEVKEHDREEIINMLEKDPEILENIIDVINDLKNNQDTPGNPGKLAIHSATDATESHTPADSSSTSTTSGWLKQ